MSRSLACLSVSFAIWLTVAGTAAGQATVEYGLGAGRAATSTAPAGKGVGDAISGLAGSLNKLVKGDQQPSVPAATRVRKRAPSKPVEAARAESPAAITPPAPAPNWEDPAGIQTGIAYEELLRRFGPPALGISSDEGQSLTYMGKNGSFQLEVRDEKVASVERPKS